MNILPPYTLDNTSLENLASNNSEGIIRYDNDSTHISYPPTYELTLPNYDIIDIPPPKYNIILNLNINLRNTSPQPIERAHVPYDFCYYCTICKDIYNLFCCKTGCYRKDSPDMRCCGLCYMCSDEPDEGCCMPTMTEYFKSGLWITTDGSGSGPDKDNCCCTLFCLPVKIPLCFPCLLATIFNSIINSCRGTNCNYLF